MTDPIKNILEFLEIDSMDVIFDKAKDEFHKRYIYAGGSCQAPGREFNQNIILKCIDNFLQKKNIKIYYAGNGHFNLPGCYFTNTNIMVRIYWQEHIYCYILHLYTVDSDFQESYTFVQQEPYTFGQKSDQIQPRSAMFLKKITGKYNQETQEMQDNVFDVENIKYEARYLAKNEFQFQQSNDSSSKKLTVVEQYNPLIVFDYLCYYASKEEVDKVLQKLADKFEKINTVQDEIEIMRKNIKRVIDLELNNILTCNNFQSQIDNVKNTIEHQKDKIDQNEKNVQTIEIYVNDIVSKLNNTLTSSDFQFQLNDIKTMIDSMKYLIQYDCTQLSKKVDDISLNANTEKSLRDQQVEELHCLFENEVKSEIHTIHEQIAELLAYCYSLDKNLRRNVNNTNDFLEKHMNDTVANFNKTVDVIDNLTNQYNNLENNFKKLRFFIVFSFSLSISIILFLFLFPTGFYL